MGDLKACTQDCKTLGEVFDAIIQESARLRGTETPKVEWSIARMWFFLGAFGVIDQVMKSGAVTAELLEQIRVGMETSRGILNDVIDEENQTLTDVIDLIKKRYGGGLV